MNISRRFNQLFKTIYYSILISIVLPNISLAQTAIIVQLQWKHQFEFAGFYAAIAQGFYARRGLDVKLREYQNGMNVINEVLLGNAQYATGNSNIIQARLEGKPLVLLANYFKQLPMVILARPGINNLADLRGKKLMIADKDLNSPLYRLAFEQEGLKVGENIQVIPHSFNVDPFVRGDVDAMSAFITNEPFYLEQKGIPFNIIDMSSYMRSLGDVYLFSTEQQTAIYPTLTQDFINATNEGWQYALDHKQEIVDLIFAQYSQRKSREALLYEADKTYDLIMPLPLPIGALFDSLIDDIAKIIKRQNGIIKASCLKNFLFQPPNSNSNNNFLYITAEDRAYLDTTKFHRISASDRAPLHFKDTDGEMVGIIEDYWGLIRDKLGLKEIVDQPLPNADASKALQVGTSDIYPSASYTKEHDAYAVFSDIYEHYPIAIVSRKNAGFISNTAALEGQIVTVGKDYDAYYLLKNRYPNIKFESVADTATALEKVASRQAYAAIDVLPTLQYQLQVSHANNLKLAGVSDVELPLQVMLRKNHIRLLPLINRAIAAITPQERLAIHKKWMLRTVVTVKDYTLLWQVLIGAIIFIAFILYWNRQLTREIAHRKRTEVKLRTLSRAVEQAHSTILITNTAARIEFANPSFFRITGYSREETIGQNTRILKSGKHNEAFYYEMWSTITQGNVWRGELCNKRKNGSIYWESATISPVKGPDGNIIHYVAVKEDISERKAIELALQKSREQYQRLVDDIGQNFIVYSRNRDGIIEYVSKGVKNIFGVSPEQVIGHNLGDIVPWRPGMAEDALKKMQHMLATGESAVPWEMQFGRPDDSLGTILVTSHPVKDENGIYSKVEGVVEDITERKRIEELIRANSEKLRNLYELSPLGIALTDMRGRYLEFNEAFINICGYPAEELKKLNYWEIAPHKHIEQESAQFTALSKTGRYGPYEAEYQRKDGKWISLRMNGVLVTGQDGHTYIWSLVEDITAQKQHEAVLHQAKEDAETANRAKSAFLANMSHELRTPLNAVLGYAQILQQDPSLNTNQRQGVTTIRRSGEYLLTLINDVLDLAKVEAGHLELFPRGFDLKRFFIELSDLFLIRAKEKGLEFHYEPGIELPNEINADEKRLRQICMNLLSNAIKFTERGEVRLTANYHNGELTIEVTDTGIGITSSMREQLFTPFVQMGEDRYKQQGTGLGLAISRNLVERMGGTIEMESELGKGSCFKVRIHMPIVDLDPVKAEIEAPLPISGFRRTDGLKEPLSVLVVDDIAENRAVVRGLLEPLGFAITEVENGAEAVAITQNQAYDVIFMDLVMPKMDGLTATHYILERQSKTNRLVIALTAGAFAEDRAACLSIGCKDYLVKPIEQANLLHVLHTHLSLEWVRANSTSTLLATPPISNTQLNAEQSKILLNMLRRGAIHEVKQYLDALLKTPDCPSQAQLLLNMASGFKLAEMRRILETTSDTSDDDSSSFQELPTNWLTQLEQAVLLAKRHKALDLLNQIDLRDKKLADKLKGWLESYDYPRVLQWIKQNKSTTHAASGGAGSI